MMTIDIRILIELILVVLTLKMVVSKWKPPLPEHLQALVCIVLGTALGCFANPTREGFVYGIISSGIAFYGAELIGNFKTIKDELQDINKD